MTRPVRDAVPNRALSELRARAGLSQQEVADRLNDLAVRDGGREGSVTANTVSRWERGISTPAPLHRRLLATLFEVPISDLALLPSSVRSYRPAEEEHAVTDGTDLLLDPRVARSQDEWRRTRRALNANRARLAAEASQLYPPEFRIVDTGLIAHPSWLPDQPVDLADITLDYQANVADPELDGTGAETSHVRPYATLARHFQRYTHAVRDLEHPRLFENRFSWRLVDLAWNDGGGRMSFGPSSYFAALDVYESLAHETAYARLLEDGTLRSAPPVMRELPLRRLIGDPFALQRRPVVPAVGTLTIRQAEDGASFLLHRRDPRSVAVAGGMLQVIPSGMFQPSSVLPAAQDADFSLWRNIMREYAEELLGYPEHGGDGRPVAYNQEPFATLEAARADGRLRIYCLGVALDALTLVGEILTVAVFDANFFDSAAGEFVDFNDEGTVLNGLLPLTESVIGDLIRTRIAPAGAGCLSLAARYPALFGHR